MMKRETKRWERKKLSKRERETEQERERERENRT